MPKDGTINRERILESATHLVIENGFAATSLDQVIAAAGTSKGAFFHHFASKFDLAQALTERYVEADIAVLNGALVATSDIVDPVDRLIAFMRFFEDGADELMEEQSSCLYISVLTEQQLITHGTAQSINRAIEAWRHEIVDLLTAAAASAAVDLGDLDALADHVFVTFEGAFLLSRSTGEPSHMRTQLGVVRRLLEGVLRAR
ncbi:TetR/AcrR family transcriptional regulator [Microcella sp.]|uniref:TetR/AcrR family transcriptional regulator n=1 Tax=Microcella sp. TaxID=1913979 RepID=UPI00256C45E6|nr:TetR/AcrR family transcriptional regulator [Microcella sp.]MBX9472988.1 TetR/AcrR family transcriptional regulator [Microcella sp.]